jgi:hypothetical protein
MATSKRKTEKQVIENYRLALSNSEKQKEIAPAMATYGYTTEEIAKGWTLWNNLREKYDLNKEEDNETNATRKVFDTLVDKTGTDYSLHRKVAKIIFRYDDVVRHTLGLNGEVPDGYIPWLEKLKTFYVGVQNDETILGKLARGRITAETISDSLTAVTAIENARTAYLAEIGESQEATRAKDLAFDEMDKWMYEFLGFAKIALADKPQLLEGMGLLIR